MNVEKTQVTMSQFIKSLSIVPIFEESDMGELEASIFHRNGLVLKVLECLISSPLSVAELSKILDVTNAKAHGAIQNLISRDVAAINVSFEIVYGKKKKIIRLVDDKRAYIPKEKSLLKIRLDQVVSLCKTSYVSAQFLSLEMKVTVSTIHNYVDSLFENGLVDIIVVSGKKKIKAVQCE